MCFLFFFNALFQCTDQVLFLASLTFPAGFFFFSEYVNEKPCPGQGGGESHLARGSRELSGVSALVGNRVILNDPKVLSFKLIGRSNRDQAGLHLRLLEERPLVVIRGTSLLMPQPSESTTFISLMAGKQAQRGRHVPGQLAMPVFSYVFKAPGSAHLNSHPGSVGPQATLPL